MLGKAQATVIVLPGGLSVRLTVPGVADALGMDACGPLNSSITPSLAGETSPEPLRHRDTSTARAGWWGELWSPAALQGPSSLSITDVVHSNKCSVNKDSIPYSSFKHPS